MRDPQVVVLKILTLHELTVDGRVPSEVRELKSKYNNKVPLHVSATTALDTDTTNLRNLRSVRYSMVSRRCMMLCRFIVVLIDVLRLNRFTE